MNRTLVGSCLALAVLLVGQPALAVIVTDVDTPIIFLQDDFEGGTVGSNPVATIGTWQIVETNAPAVSVFGPVSPGPGAAQGSQYLSINAADGESARAYISGLSVAAGTDLRYEGSFLLPRQTTPGNLPAMYNFTNGDPNFPGRRTWFGFTQAVSAALGTYVTSTGAGPNQMAAVYYDGSAWRNTKKLDGSNYYVDFGSWHDLVIDYNVGSTYTVTIDGVPSQPMAPANAGTVGGFAAIDNAGGPAVFYTDARPDPQPLNSFPLVTHDGNALHTDNFESGTVGQDPNRGAPGGWLIGDGGTGGNVSVFGPASGGPGAAQGQQYLRLGNTSSSELQSAMMSFADTTGGTLEAHHMIYLEENRTGTGTINLDFTDGDPGFPHRRTWVAILHPLDAASAAGLSSSGVGPGQGVLGFYGPGGWQNVTSGGALMFFDYDQWNEFTMTFQPAASGSPSYTITLNGITSDVMAGFPGSVSGYQVFNNGAGLQQFYIDAIAVPVPEPGTGALGLLGLVGLLALAARRRRE